MTPKGDIIAFAAWEIPDDGSASKTLSGINAMPLSGKNHVYNTVMGPLMEDMGSRDSSSDLPGNHSLNPKSLV